MSRNRRDRRTARRWIGTTAGARVFPVRANPTLPSHLRRASNTIQRCVSRYLVASVRSRIRPFLNFLPKSIVGCALTSSANAAERFIVRGPSLRGSCVGRWRAGRQVVRGPLATVREVRPPEWRASRRSSRKSSSWCKDWCKSRVALT